MSRSLKIKRPKWINPEDTAYLRFFGTLLHGLSMGEVKLSPISFVLKRKSLPHSVTSMSPARRLLPTAAKLMMISDAQRSTLKTLGSLANNGGYEPRILSGPSEMLTIEMMNISDGRTPVYVRRRT